MVTFYLNKHLLYVMTCVGIWMATLYNGFYLMHLHSNEGQHNPTGSDLTDSYMKKLIVKYEMAYLIFILTQLITLLQGLLLAIVRTNEPFYQYLVEKEIYSWFGQLYFESNENQTNMRKNLAVQLMNQQLSVELVYSILFTVTEHTVGIPKSIDWKIYQPYDFINKNEFLIESMTVRNPESFAVVKSSDVQKRKSVMRRMTSVFEPSRSKNDKLERSNIDTHLSKPSIRSSKSSIYADSNLISEDQYHVIDKDITCIEFAPDVFAHLRNMDGFTIHNIRESLGPEIQGNVQKIFKAGEGMGKSGSFFFFSHDD